MKKQLIFILLFTTLINLLSQTNSLTGIVADQVTGKPIPFVNIGIKDSYFGTSSNENGEFRITLEKGSYILVISCIGYKTKLVYVKIPDQSELSVNLNPNVIELPEVIVDAEENPAYSIIRKAIENKEKNKAGLSNYYYNFYSKNILTSGRDIVFIEEDLGEGIKKLNKNAEEIKQKIYHTENISKKTFSSKDLNILENGIIDFTEDSLKLGDDFIFHLPLSKFAFKYYDYELVGIKQSDKQNFYQIKVIPYSKIRPTFAGEILIDDSSFALAGVDLTLISRNLLPFTNLKMSIIQNLIYQNNYWLPKYYNIVLETNMNYYHIFRLDSAITSYVKVFNNIKVNVDENSQLLKNIKQIADTSFKNEPQFVSLNKMDSIRLYPLSLKEDDAYNKIDSNKTIVSSLQLGGIGGEYVKKAEQNRIDKDTSGFNVFSTLKYLSFRNNRVDGISLGLRFSNFKLGKLFGFSAGTDYSFVRENMNSEFNFEFKPNDFIINKFSLFGYYKSKPAYVYTPYSQLFNTLSVLFGFEDQYDYYQSKGIGAYFQKELGGKTNIKLGLTFENQKSLKAKKYYSLFNSKQYLRPNLVTGKGNDNRFVFNINSGKSPYDIDFVQNTGFISQVEISSKFLGSDFNYTKINAAYQFYTNTFYDELLFSPYLGVFIEASTIFGDYKTQHLNTPQTAMGIFSPFGTFKGISPYQFISEKQLAVHIEHNWRKTFFDMLGIYFPVEWNLEFTVGASILSIWNDKILLEVQKRSQFYWETYAGISGILGLINVNAAYSKLDYIVIRTGISVLL